MSLYFIALNPPETLCEEIQAIKQDFSVRFSAKHALKLPAHITLQIPFKMEPKRKAQLIETLRQVVKKQDALKIRLSGFGSFPPRVVFIKVEGHEQIRCLFQKLQERLREENFLQEKEKMSSLHPHITIATRDLEKRHFRNAWNEHEHKKYNSSFTVKSIFVFKHNGKTWDIYKELGFKDNLEPL